MKKLSILCLLILVFFSCRKDTDNLLDIKTSSNPPEIIDKYFPTTAIINASISAYVFDENENPVEDAIVTLRGNTYTTDEKGYFYALEVEMDGEGTFFTVEKEGYFNGARRFFPKQGIVTYAQVQMMKLNEIGKFASEIGAVVNGADGISLSFPPNVIKKESGGMYSGEVRVAAKWLDPTANNVSDLMPGALQGVNNQLEEVSLVSFGMMAVELFGENGEELNIADDLKVELSFPVPASIQAEAPDEIPLWFYEDEKFGIWVEDGKANLVDGKYVGEVTHFSFWNCDDPYPLVQVSGRLVSELNGVPIANARVNVQIANSTLSSHGYTDTDGYFNGKMPKDVAMVLTFGDPTSCNLSPVSIGPFTEDTNVGEIVLGSNDIFELNGAVVDCNSNPINNGLVEVTYGSQRKNIFLQGTNIFSFGLINCEAATELSIFGYDLDLLEAGSPESFDITAIVDVGNVVACGAIPYYFFFKAGLDSITYFDIGQPDIWAKPSIDTLYPNGLNFGFANLSSPVSGFGINSKLPLPVGTYNKDDLSTISFFLYDVPFPKLVLDCNNNIGTCDELKSLNITILVNEGIGGVIQGELEGVADILYAPHPDSLFYDYPFSGSFRLLLE